MGEVKKPSTQTIACPDCGLVLQATDQACGFNFAYDMREWQRVCARVQLGDPVWCLILRDGTYKLPVAMDGDDNSHLDGRYARGASE